MRASTETAKRAALYRMAALNLEQNKINYLGYVATGSSAEEHMRLASIFTHTDGAGRFDFGSNEPENRDHRILAACFMAAMIEAGDA